MSCPFIFGRARWAVSIRCWCSSIVKCFIKREHLSVQQIVYLIQYFITFTWKCKLQVDKFIFKFIAELIALSLREKSTTSTALDSMVTPIVVLNDIGATLLDDLSRLLTGEIIVLSCFLVKRLGWSTCDASKFALFAHLVWRRVVPFVIFAIGVSSCSFHATFEVVVDSISSFSSLKPPIKLIRWSRVVYFFACSGSKSSFLSRDHSTVLICLKYARSTEAELLLLPTTSSFHFCFTDLLIISWVKVSPLWLLILFLSQEGALSLVIRMPHDIPHCMIIAILRMRDVLLRLIVSMLLRCIVLFFTCFIMVFECFLALFNPLVIGWLDRRHAELGGSLLRHMILHWEGWRVIVS